MTSQVTISEKRKKRGLWPVLGFILIIALLIISYAVAPAVIEFCKANFRGFTTRGTNPQTVHLLFTVLIFLVLGGVHGAYCSFVRAQTRHQRQRI